MIALALAFLAGFATCAAIVFAIFRSSDDHEPIPPIEKDW
jgi:hypothetical protein